MTAATKDDQALPKRANKRQKVHAAWQDEDDDALNSLPASHPYKAAAAAVPSWAVKSLTPVADSAVGRRAQGEDVPVDVAASDLLQSILSSDAPVATAVRAAKRQDQTNKVNPTAIASSNVTVNHRGPVTDMVWHTGNELLLVGHRRGLTAWHASKDGLTLQGALNLTATLGTQFGPIKQVTLVPGGDAAVLLHDGAMQCPTLVPLEVGAMLDGMSSSSRSGNVDPPVVSPMAFMTQVYRASPFRLTSASQSTHQAKRRRGDDRSARGTAGSSEAISKFVFAPGHNTQHAFANVVGHHVWLGSLKHGSLFDSIPCGDEVIDVAFANSTELIVAVSNGVRLYDVRQIHQGPVKIWEEPSKVSALSAMNNTVAVGTQSGEVSVYMGALSIDGGKKVTLSNLRTEIDMVDLGFTGSAHESVGLLYGSSLHAGGVRFASLPSGTVATQFPLGGSQRGFTSIIACSKSASVPLFAMCEQRKQIEIFTV